MQGESSERDHSNFWQEDSRGACFSKSCVLENTQPITFKLGPILESERGNLRQVILVKVKSYKSSCGRPVEWQPFYRSTGENSSVEFGPGSEGTWLPFDFISYQYEIPRRKKGEPTPPGRWVIWVNKQKYTRKNQPRKHHDPTSLDPSHHGIKYNTRFGNDYYRSISYRLGGGVWRSHSIGGVSLDILGDLRPRENIVPENGYAIGDECTQDTIDSHPNCTSGTGSRDIRRNAGDVNDFIGSNNSYGINLESCTLTAQEISELVHKDLAADVNPDQKYFLKPILDKTKGACECDRETIYNEFKKKPHKSDQMRKMFPDGKLPPWLNVGDDSRGFSSDFKGIIKHGGKKRKTRKRKYKKRKTRKPPKKQRRKTRHRK